MATRITPLDSLVGSSRLSTDRTTLNGWLLQRTSMNGVSIDDTDSPFTPLPGDHFIIASGAAAAVNIALPPAADWEGHVLCVIATSVAGGNVTVTPDGAETINGAGVVTTLSSAYAKIKLYSNGTGWLTPP